MNAIPGQIALGTLELGGIPSPIILNGTFTATASPALALTTSGGTPASPFSSLPGTILLGAFELGAIHAHLVPLLVGNFTATASPTALFIGQSVAGTFTATASPLVGFTPAGTTIFTANPQAAFTGLGNAYTQMGFTGTAYPALTFTPDITGVSIVVTAYPQLMWFVSIGQSGHCASGAGVGTRDSSVINYVF